MFYPVKRFCGFVLIIFLGVALQTFCSVAYADPEPSRVALLPDFSTLVKGLSPAVVNVSVEGAAQRIDGDSAEKDNEDEKKEPESPFKSVGSGFIIDPNGYIVTNYHVVGDASSAVVRLLDDRNEYRASVVGKDQKTDLALLKITPKTQLIAATLGDSDAVEVGQWVLAIGNQFQLGQTVTAGIISAKSRKVPSRGSPYDSFLQTDASINPGSSGGPLFNTRGEVVGINSAIFSPGHTALGGSGFNIGIGFAIPINVAKSVLEQLRQNHRVTRGLLGVLIQQVDSSVAQALELTAPDGALVADVLPDTPAVKAGFKRFDVITKFNGHTIADFDDLPVLVASTPIGAKVDVEIIRNKHTMPLQVVIEELKDSEPQVHKTDFKFNQWGLVLENITPVLARSMNITATHGIVVTAVQTESISERAGFLRGDVIEAAGGTDTPDLESFDRVVTSLAHSHPLLVAVRRRDASRILVLKPAEK